jgi:hypothetical protein
VLQRCYEVVTKVLQWCYSDVTSKYLQRFLAGVPTLLQFVRRTQPFVRHNLEKGDVIMVLQRCYKEVTRALQRMFK